jgi:hypothetical protein
VLVNPLGKVVAKPSSSWRYWRSLFSFRHYAMRWLDYLLRRVLRDSFRENVRAFKEHVQRGSLYVFDYDDLLNQVKVYEEILNSLGR